MSPSSRRSPLTGACPRASGFALSEKEEPPSLPLPAGVLHHVSLRPQGSARKLEAHVHVGRPRLGRNSVSTLNLRLTKEMAQLHHIWRGP